MGAYLRADTDTLLMASVEKDPEAETESVAAKSGKEMSSKERDAETEAQDLKQLASEALKAMQNKTTLSADSMSKSPSTEILENYNQQPLHVRSRAEQWELPRSEIQLTDKLGEGDGGVIYHAHWRGLDVVAKMLKADTDRSSSIDSDVAKADLINEISVLSRLRHPNVRGGDFVVIELIEGL